MAHTYHLTRVSANKKTGPIPVSTTSKSTCPASCPLKGNGCYAESGPLALHWNAVSKGGRGHDLDHFCHEIKRLPKGQLWRYGQAGDLPGDTCQVDAGALQGGMAQMMAMQGQGGPQGASPAMAGPPPPEMPQPPIAGPGGPSQMGEMPIPPELGGMNADDGEGELVDMPEGAPL